MREIQPRTKADVKMRFDPQMCTYRIYSKVSRGLLSCGDYFPKATFRMVLKILQGVCWVLYFLTEDLRSAILVQFWQDLAYLKDNTHEFVILFIKIQMYG